jgi:hypothetical protein
VLARARPAAVLFGALLVAWLDGWLPFPSPRPDPGARPPSEMARALSSITADLGARAGRLAEHPEVARSLQGGGIAVRRQALFRAAGEAMAGAAPGTWIALADTNGDAQAWWGDAPPRVPAPPTAGPYAVRWSATRLEVLSWRRVGRGADRAVVCAARDLPVEAPDFGFALGLRGRSLEWEPVAPGSDGRVLLASPAGAPLVAGRAAGGAAASEQVARRAVLIAILALGLLAMAGDAPPWWIGASLALLFLAAEAFDGVRSRALAAPAPWLLAVGLAALPTAIALLRRERGGAWRAVAGWILFAAAFYTASSLTLPDLGAPLAWGGAGFRALVALTALIGAALAVGASASPPRRAGWTTAAVLATAASILGLLFAVSVSPAFMAAAALLAAGCYEAWRRATASAPPSGLLGPFRLVAGAALLLVLTAAPRHEHRRAADAFRTAAAIRLPGLRPRLDGRRRGGAPRRRDRRALRPRARAAGASAGRRPLDLAYRLWREGEEEAPSPALVAWEVRDATGEVRSRFSLIPEAEDPDAAPVGRGPDRASPRRHRAAERVLRDGGQPWGVAVISVADWPVWDPLPPRLEVYRRLVRGEAAPPPGPRPVLVAFGPDGSRRTKGRRRTPPRFRPRGRPRRRYASECRTAAPSCAASCARCRTGSSSSPSPGRTSSSAFSRRPCSCRLRPRCMRSAAWSCSGDSPRARRGGVRSFRPPHARSAAASSRFSSSP